MQRSAMTFLLLIAFFALTPLAVLADATIVVNTVADEDGTGSTCSLREAITAANTNANYGGCVGAGSYGTDTISFDAGVFGTARTITLTSNLPDITDHLTIIGSDMNLLTISGADSYRPFRITNGSTAAISNLTIRDGLGDNGGAIWINTGSLNLSTMNFRDNTASLLGGAIYNENGSLHISGSSFSGNSSSLIGGAIYTGPNIYVLSSTFTGNSAANQGGAITALDGFATISGSSFGENSANQGGALAGNMKVVNSSFVGNTATTAGGAIYSASQSVYLRSVSLGFNGSASGGGLFSDGGYLELVNTIVADSTSGGDCAIGTAAFVSFYSMIKDGSCGIVDGSSGNLVADPLFDVRGLQNNGGSIPTLTISPLSPAINAGDHNSLTELSMNVDFNGDGDFNDNLDYDQRGTGFNRVVPTDELDMGAIEQTATLSLQVDTTSDSNLSICTSAANDCSLRGAINLANIMVGADTISFDAAVFATPQTITVTGDLPSIDDSLTVLGSGSSLLTIDATAGLPFTVGNDAVVTITDVRVINADTFNMGGAITVNDGTVTVNNSSFENNHAVNGAIYAGYGTTLTVNNSSFNGNSAMNDGGAINGATGSSVRVNNSSFSGNSSGNNGGAIFSDSAVHILNSSFSENSAAMQGGAVYANFNASITIGGSGFNGNSANSGGGFAGTRGKLFNSSFHANTASIQGGAIFSTNALTLLHVAIGANDSPNVDGVYAQTGSVTILNSVIADNCLSDGSTPVINNTLIEDASCGVVNDVNGNLISESYLAPFANYGGTTSVLGLLPVSPAINAGSSAYLSEAAVNVDFNGDGDTDDVLDTDQRGTGFDRVINGTVDMGPFEANPSTSAANALPVRNYYITLTPTLTWAHLTWAENYEIQISDSTTFATLYCGGTRVVNANSASYTTCPLSARTYYWRVRAISNTNQQGAWSAPEVFVIAAP
jgi:fibronectin-binding autotransporter adhesin